MPARRPPVTLDELAFRRIKIAFGVTTTRYRAETGEKLTLSEGEREKERGNEQRREPAISLRDRRFVTTEITRHGKLDGYLRGCNTISTRTVIMRISISSAAAARFSGYMKYLV